MGSPHVYVVTDLLETFKAIATRHGMSLELPNFLRYQTQAEEFATTKLQELSQEDNIVNRDAHKRNFIAKTMKICIVKKCWNPALFRVEMCAAAGSGAEAVMESMIRILVSKGKGDEKPNQAPRGALERKLQRWVDKMQKGDRQAPMSEDEE